MSPALSAFDVGNGGWMDAKTCSDAGLGFCPKGGENLTSIGFGESRHTVTVATSHSFGVSARSIPTPGISTGIHNHRIANMSPGVIALDGSDIAFGHAVLGRERASRASVSQVPPNATDIFGGQLRMRMAFAPGDTMRVPLRPGATLSRAVQHVVPSGPKKQMARVDARRVVTAVTDEEASRNWTVVKHPRNAMCKPWDSADAENAIVGIRSARHPRPALINPQAFNLRPKALGDRFWLRTHTSLDRFHAVDVTAQLRQLRST